MRTAHVHTVSFLATIIGTGISAQHFGLLVTATGLPILAIVHCVIYTVSAHYRSAPPCRSFLYTATGGVIVQCVFTLFPSSFNQPFSEWTLAVIWTSCISEGAFLTGWLQCGHTSKEGHVYIALSAIITSLSGVSSYAAMNLSERTIVPSQPSMELSMPEAVPAETASFLESEPTVRENSLSAVRIDELRSERAQLRASALAQEEIILHNQAVLNTADDAADLYLAQVQLQNAKLLAHRIWDRIAEIDSEFVRLKNSADHEEP